MEQISVLQATALRDIIAINDKRMVSYRNVIPTLFDNEDIHSVLCHLLHESLVINKELSREMKGVVADTVAASGPIYSIWLETKLLFTGSDKKSLLEECLFSDVAALKALSVALDMRYEFTGRIRMLLMQQQTSLMQFRRKILSLRTNLSPAL